MTARVLPLMLGGLLLLALPAFAQGGGEVSVKVGAKRTLIIPGMERVAVGNPEVAEIRAGPGDRLEITGRSPGETDLKVWGQRGPAQVFRIRVSR